MRFRWQNHSLRFEAKRGPGFGTPLCLAWYYANAESEVVAMLAPLVGQPSHASANPIAILTARTDGSGQDNGSFK
jgi:hypothetical protein